ncbi:uncharacterized protein K452DRAFT_239254 [Aplosporella prunicola CBS 121167]|uniref:Heterokaryon incompatibility domain-containing protein n=1 Tax=Aplosporella prunicola CBS 121167 TaxID=1176127 RepID=A0A6A6AVA2_9PEZI|nr:uncharacterized protein K452DRAFT_239254 [Aplosporella prunicola CBS 121167]KAF2135516.1 hypothetical protein K452DRAFT_239254 [Aplosporella prunicola CBS 121167]
MANKNGWCPSTIGYLIDSATLTSIVSAVQKRAFDSKSHTGCRIERCEASIIDPEQYEAKHTDPGCNCEWIRPPLADVKTLISQNYVPVITFQDLSPWEQPSFSVDSFRNKAYIAISHVWSDGLGSTTEKGLPLCQVRRLSNLATELIPGGAFWIDSLCVPSEKGPRRSAIGLMALTYSDAQKVLILDESIQRLPFSAPVEDRLLCALSSGWMRRLWTLQEGALSRELLFRFQDVSMPAPELISRVGQLALSSVLSGLSSVIYRILKKKQNDSYFSIGDVARALRWRTTSRPSDETLAIASLLGIDPLALLAEDKSERRFAKLLEAVGAVPRNILFASGAKMTEPGLRWAPRTFMTARGGLSLTINETEACVSPRGLVAEYASYVFDARELGAERFWHISLPKEDAMLRIADAFEQEGTFRCNVLLFPHHLATGEALAAVGAVSVPENLTEAMDSENVLHCVYQRRLIARRVLLGHGENMLSAKWKGIVKICIG